MILDHDQDYFESADRFFSSRARVWRENPGRTIGRWTEYGPLSNPLALAETRFPDSMGWPVYIEHLPANFVSHNVGGKFLEDEIENLRPSELISADEWKQQGLRRIIILNGSTKTTIPGANLEGIETNAENITFWFKRKNGRILPSTYNQKKINVSYVTRPMKIEKN